MLGEAGIHRADCFLTNVFNLKPVNNDIESLCDSLKTSNLPPLKAGKHLRPEYHRELDRLFAELESVRPNVCVLLGNTSCWALLGSGGISKIRGTVTPAAPAYNSPRAGSLRNTKCLPAYHPAAILRQWELRAVTVLDFKKARRESEFPEIRRPARSVHFVENLADLETVERDLQNAKSIAFDIETMGDQITCIGFAPSEAVAYVIPFHDPRSPTHSFWPVVEDEVRAWQSVSRILNLPCRKIAQNGMYDVTFLWRSVGIPVRNFDEDTMLLHHSLQPESEKGLAFLGSVYTNESSWKLLRTKGKTTIKRDE